MTQRRSARQIAVYWLIITLVSIAIFDSLASVALIYRYRMFNDSVSTIGSEPSFWSTYNLIYKIVRKAGWIDPSDRSVRNNAAEDGTELKLRVEPSPFFADDARFGYIANPGRYLQEYMRREPGHSEWKHFKVQATINEDGTRWTGANPGGARNVYVFGDSFVFGQGVNDEQTFAYLVQQAFPQWTVHLYALAGYSLTQAYLRMQLIKERIRKDDIVVLGYASFYDPRHVADPGRLRRIHDYKKKYSLPKSGPDRTHPRVLLSKDGSLVVDYVREDCDFNDGYCDRDGYTESEQKKVTAALIDRIADAVSAPVILLYFEGAKDNPVLTSISKNIEIVSALESDFDYEIRDRVETFDSHPGPYWHYAMFRRLAGVLKKYNRTD